VLEEMINSNPVWLLIKALH